MAGCFYQLGVVGGELGAWGPSRVRGKIGGGGMRAGGRAGHGGGGGGKGCS